MRTTTVCVLLLGILFRTSAAQSVPDIRDVYSIERSTPQLGPAASPEQVVQRALETLQEVRALRYEARFIPPDASESSQLAGTVLLGKGADGSFDRLRVTIRGSREGGESFVAVVGSDGGGFFSADLTSGIVVEGTCWDALGELGDLAKGVVLPTGPLLVEGSPRPFVTLPAITELGDEPCASVHFTDPIASEHVYLALSSRDALPRRVQRIGMDGDGRPWIAELHIANVEVNPSIPIDAFVPFRPARSHAQRVNP